jgi:hypothetical protein
VLAINDGSQPAFHRFRYERIRGKPECTGARTGPGDKVECQWARTRPRMTDAARQDEDTMQDRSADRISSGSGSGSSHTSHGWLPDVLKLRSQTDVPGCRVAAGEGIGAIFRRHAHGRLKFRARTSPAPQRGGGGSDESSVLPRAQSPPEVLFEEAPCAQFTPLIDFG